MKRASLTLRLAFLLATFSFAASSLMGGALYYALGQQLSLRDDAALVARVEQIRTLLTSVDALQLIHEKPDLFANMLGNTESLLVIRYADGTPLLEVNPLRREVPDVVPVPASQPLTLDVVHHTDTMNGMPMVYMAAISPSKGAPLEILSARVLVERTHMLKAYRNNILIFALAVTLISVILAFIFARRGMSPVHRLTDRMALINTRTLSSRVESTNVPTELVALVTQFNAMLERLEQGFQQIKQVSADMAHDLRTPVTTLLGQTEVALGAPRDNDYYRMLLGSNYEELQRISRMIDNMLFLAQAQQPDQEIERVHVEVLDEIARVCDYFEDVALERRVAIDVRGGGAGFVDVLLFRRALANLLSNAVRYADPESRIEVVAEPVVDGITLCVTNHGPTISPEHQKRIFDRFYRVDLSRTDSAQSCGLGLSIVKSIMQLHHGRCRVKSENGVTVFELFFPKG